MPLSRMAGMIFGARKIRKLLEESPVDLIHTSDYRSVLLCAINSAKITRVVTCRQAFDYTHYSLHGTSGPILARVIVKTFAMACRKCECVVAVSDFVRNSSKNDLAARMSVIHNGVEQDIFKPVDKEKKVALRSRLNLPQDKHVFLTADLSKRKDPVTIIKAFLRSILNQSAALVILGNGALRNKCLRLAGANDHIRIVGFVKNVREYLGAADTFVSASLTEGCPNAVMEALACGLPVILSDIPAHREILAYNESAGLMFPVKDVTSLSEILSKTTNMNYSEQSIAALSIIKNHLNARNMSLKYQELYAQLHEQTIRKISE